MLQALFAASGDGLNENIMGKLNPERTSMFFHADGYSGASHGCVNVRDESSMSTLFDEVPIGTKVVIYRQPTHTVR